MALNPWQQAVSNLAHSLGLRGQAEQQIYQRPEYLALVDQFWGKIPLPAGVDPSQVVSNQGGVLEYRDAEGYVHRLERDLNGLSSQLGTVRQSDSNRPPILPPPAAQAQGEKDLNLQLIQQMMQRFGQGVPNAPLPPDFSGVLNTLGMFRPAPTPPNLSGIQSQFGGLQQSFSDIVSRLLQPAQLAQLTGQDQSNLSAIDANTRAMLAKQQQDLQGSLVAQLYGRGFNQSNIANQAAANFAESQGRLNLQASSDAATRMLGLQQFISQLGQGNLALAGQTVGQQGQTLGQQGNLALGQGQLALGGYEAENQARLQAIGQMIQAMMGQGQLALGGYSAQTGANQDFLSSMIQQLNALNQIDLSRQATSGQLGLDQAQLNEQIRQFNANLSQRQEEQRIQERAARDAFTRQLIMGGIGLAGSLFSGGLSGLFTGGGGAGAATGGGFLTPQGGLPPLGTFGAPPLTGYGGRR